MRALVVGEEARDRAAVATDRVLDGERRLARVRGRVRAKPYPYPTPTPTPSAGGLLRDFQAHHVARLRTEAEHLGGRPRGVGGRVGWTAAWDACKRGEASHSMVGLAMARLGIAGHDKPSRGKGSHDKVARQGNPC